MDNYFDLIIVGAGPVGCSLASALKNEKISIAIIDSKKAYSPVDEDKRTLALSYKSHLILKRLNLWKKITNQVEIKNLHISQENSFGCSFTTYKDLSLPNIGYAMSFKDLKMVLLASLQNSRVKFFEETIVENIIKNDGYGFIETNKNKKLKFSCLVICSGGKLLPTKLGFQYKNYEYKQSVLIGELVSTKPHLNTAYERFTKNGPIALLPKNGHGKYALVWSVGRDQLNSKLKNNKQEIINSLQEKLGFKIGKIQDLNIFSTYDVSLNYAKRVVQNNIVLLGNSAQSINPIAAQGFNLSLVDSWELSKVLKKTNYEKKKLFLQYEKSREYDRFFSIHITHLLSKYFSKKLQLTFFIKISALSMLNLFPYFKNIFIKKLTTGKFL